MEGNKEGANLKLATKCHLLNTCGGEGGSPTVRNHPGTGKVKISRVSFAG